MAPIYCATMSIKSDRWIRRMAHQHRMIEPFADDPARGGVISYGVSSYGYDMRVAPEFKIFTNALSAVGGPQQFCPQSFLEVSGGVLILPPQFLAPAPAVEEFPNPPHPLPIRVGKNTYAPCGSI